MLPQVRKTSHKAAEQKRRDSLKTTFDELRGLLPPIPLPSASHAGEGEDGGSAGSGSSFGSSAGTSAGNSVFGNAVKPLLPGALPPRGPPKAGGEGPNKGVSKLQLLICGNEYIKTLKGRVERRDDEIVRLRQEVRKLRQLLSLVSNQGVLEMESSGKSDGSTGKTDVGEDQGEPYATTMESLMEQLDLDLDLDRDIDAVEKMGSGILDTTAGGGRRDDNILSIVKSDLAIEDYDDEE